MWDLRTTIKTLLKYVYMVKSILERMRMHGKGPNKEQVAFAGMCWSICSQHVAKYKQCLCPTRQFFASSSSYLFGLFHFGLILCMSLVGTTVPSLLRSSSF